MNETTRAAVAEATGAFALCFIGAGAICTMKLINAGGGADLVAIAGAHALVLAVMISSLGAVSGAHFNPAVTFGLLVVGKIAATRAGTYVAAQLVGATLAGFAVRAIYPAEVYAAVNGGTPGLGTGVTMGTAILIEAILTFFLMTAVMGTAVSAKAPKIGGFGIGLVLFFDIVVGGPLTGASMNPARTFGPGLAAGYWDAHLVYWVGPLAGGALAALLYEKVFGTSAAR